MCIRDSYMDVGTTHTPQSHPQVAASQILHMHITHTFHFKLQLIPVSYTHLDVYKRQVHMHVVLPRINGAFLHRHIEEASLHLFFGDIAAYNRHSPEES